MIFGHRRYRANTRTHIVIELPDNRHIVEIFKSEWVVVCYVQEDVSNRTRESFRLDKRKTPQWEDLMEEFINLAHKKYCAQIRHKSATRERQRWGL